MRSQIRISQMVRSFLQFISFKWSCPYDIGTDQSCFPAALRSERAISIFRYFGLHYKHVFLNNCSDRMIHEIVFVH